MKENLLDAKSNKNLNSLSKAIVIISKIIKVFAIISIIGIALGMLVVGILSTKINIKDNQISIKGSKEKITIIDKKDSVSFKIGDQESEPIKLNIKDINKVLNQKSVSKLLMFVEVSLLVLIAYIVIGILILNMVIKIFTNTKENSPFNDDNVIYIKKIGYYLIACIIISFAVDMIMSLLFSASVVSFNMTNIIPILFVFAIAYIFEYGKELEYKVKDSE